MEDNMGNELNNMNQPDTEDAFTVRRGRTAGRTSDNPIDRSGERRIHRRGRRKPRRTLTRLLLCVSFFLLGLVVGMVVLNMKSSKEIAAVKEELDTVIREQSAINVTNVYVPERKINEGKIAMNSYKTENFRIDEGFMAYFDENGEKISHLGCDLSYHNKNVNWEELAASGCEFVMLRCGYRGYSEGGLLKDEKFDEYAQKAKEVGIDVGVYFFTQAINEEEAIEEANYVLEILEDHEITYPVAFDTEYINDAKARTNTADISDELRSRICIAFCERIREFGYYPIIYASENWMRRNMDLKMLTNYEFWAPQYLDENDFLFDFSIWQYTEKGSIPGVVGDVDLDISMVDYASFVPAMREAYLNGGKIETIDSKGTLKITTGHGDEAPAEEPAEEPAEDSSEDEVAGGEEL